MSVHMSMHAPTPWKSTSSRLVSISATVADRNCAVVAVRTFRMLKWATDPKYRPRRERCGDTP